MATQKVATKKSSGNAKTEDTKIETFEIVPLDRIGSDSSYQRYLSMNYVQQLLSRWDPRACGPLLVSRRKNGALFIIDGQHRLEAMKMREETQAMCRVTNNLDEAEEAKIRIATQFIKPERAWERFKARVVSKDKEALAIVALLRTVNVQVQMEPRLPAGATNVVRSVRSIENIYALDKGVTLTSLLNLLMDAHGEINRHNSRGVYLRAVSWFLFQHPDTDKEVLSRIFKQEWNALETRARSTRSVYGTASLWTGIYRQIVIAYNKATKANLKYNVSGSTHAMGTRTTIPT